MASRLKIIAASAILLFTLNQAKLQAQILSDTASVRLIIKGIDCVYNFDFNTAEEIFNNLNKSYPGHPVNYLLKGMLTYWKYYPLIPSSPETSIFENDLKTSMELCKKNNNPDLLAEYLLTNLCSRGFLLLYYTDNALNIEVFPMATSSYSYIIQSFDFLSSYPDFNFFAGLYNYYTEVYPEEYPIYKPLMLLFKKGNRIKGLSELKEAAAKSIFLRAETMSFLSEIYLYYENSAQQATAYSKSLTDLYPNNPEYLGTYVKNLLISKRYDEADKVLKIFTGSSDNSYFKAMSLILEGILAEKKNHDFKYARELYIKGIQTISPFGYLGNEYAAYGYFGLSRLSAADGDQHYKKVYLKMALKLADFKNINFN